MKESKIEWTKLAPANAVAFAMALRAHRLHIKPVGFFVSAMMVVFLGLLSAVEARQFTDTGKTPDPHRSVDGIARLAPQVIQRTAWLSCFSGASKAFRLQSIGAGAVDPKFISQPPSPTAPTEFFAIGNAPVILIKRNPDTFSGCDF